MSGPASVALLDALRRRPGLEVTGRDAWQVLLRQGDVAAAEHWAEGVLDLLHANAGAVCLTAFLRLQGSARRLADVARDVAEVCRYAGASAAVAAIEAWAASRDLDLAFEEGSDFWPGLRRLAREAPDCVPLAAGHAGRIMAAVGQHGFSAFVALGLRSAGRDRARRAAFFSLTDQAALHALAQGEGHGFTTQERGLKLFSTALWGRVLALRPLPVAPGRAPARRASLSDGVVLLPETFPGVPKPAQAPLYRAATAHALAHLMAGTPRQKVGQLKPMQLAVIGAIEDARVEALAMRRFPGLRRLWAAYHTAMPEGVTAPSLLARLSRALFDPFYADNHGFVLKAQALFAAADPLDSVESRRIGGLLGNDLGQMRVQFNARDYVVEPAYRDDGLGLWDFGEQPDAPPDVIEMMVEAARLRQEEGEGRSDQPPLRQAATGAARAVIAPPESVLLARYPEWDRHEGVERPDWTTVRAGLAPMGDVRHLEAALAGLSDLRRRIDRLVHAACLGRPRRLKRQPDGMELDIDAVVDAEVARVAGGWPDARVFRTTTLQARDLATVVLVDVSESTRFGRVLEIERIAVALLAEAMAGLGDPFALLAFASDGREQVQLTRIKNFAEPFAQPARARLAALSSGLSTRLGAALRHAGAEIAGVRSYRRLVLVLTDGEPSDIDVPDPLDLVEDSRRAVFGLRAQGIDAFAIVLGAEGAETAARIFGRSAYVTVRQMDDLPARLSDLYFRLSRR